MDITEEYEKRLSVPQGLFTSLLHEDDWSFVIKLHAFLEGATSHALAAFLLAPSLLDVFTNVEMSDSKRGKLAFIAALELLDPSARSYIRALSELRNKLAHNIVNASFSVSDYLTGLDRNQIASARKSLGFILYTGTLTLDATPEEAFSVKPKLYILAGSLEILWRLHIKELEAKIRAGNQQLGELFLERSKEDIP